MSSYVDQPSGDWEERKITILGAVRSFISQLTIGDDLTKISMPAEFLYPFSALELGGSRSLGHIQLLLRSNREKDPFDRLLAVIRYTISFLNKERMQKKPYNPILAETHTCWVDLRGDKQDRNTEKDYGISKYFAQQIVHHPPMSAYIIENDKENVRVNSTVVFATQFHGNSVTIHPNGSLDIELRNYDEKYIYTNPMPDVGVKNVILGTRRASWEGELTIKCEKSGYQATLQWKEEGWYCVNVVTGFISKINDPQNKLYTIYGPCNDVVNIINTGTNQTEVLLDAGKLKKNVLQYLPEDKQSDVSSLKLWKEVGKAIVANDMYTADIAKRVIEDAQRKRRKEGTSFVPDYFSLDEKTNKWIFVEEKMKEIDNVIDSVLTSDDISQSMSSLSINKETSR